MAMRQLGAEAAARGAQRKTSGNIPKVALTPTSPSLTTTAQTPTPATVMAREEAAEPADAESTAAKTPAVLAAEGKSQTTSDKMEASSPTINTESMPAPTSFPPKDLLSPSDKSTEEQVLDMRRTSTMIRQPSRLSESTHADQSHQLLPDEAMAAPTDPETTEPAAEPAAEAVPQTASSEEVASMSSKKSEELSRPSSEILAGARRRSHRGSSVEEADIEQIRKIEDQSRIREEEEPEDAMKEGRAGSSEQEVKPQETKVKDADAAGLSVGD